MKIESYIENLIEEGKIDPIELDRMITEEREKSPLLLIMQDNEALKQENVYMKNKVQLAEQISLTASRTQQELLELLIDMGVI